MTDIVKDVVEIPDALTVRELSALLKSSPMEVIKTLMANGVMASINQQIDYDTAAITAEELGFDARPIAREEEGAREERGETPAWRKLIENERPEDLKSRPPVVTVLGHVDHGKTSLLDVIRSTNVAAGEAGGITQRIAAYQVKHRDRLITFLDTPGHAAFTDMRARGAQATDIAILVVAADDGVMPQTREAIAHARAAGVPMIVALNKMDKPNANPERVKQQLADQGLVPDEWDGDTMVVPASARNKTGIDDLLEAILLVADSRPSLANPRGKPAGTVIEAELDKARGPVATLLVQNGRLRVGDIVVAGTAYGRVKAMFDYNGRKIAEAGPSVPASIMGLNDIPRAGDLFTVVDSNRKALAFVDERREAAKVSAVHKTKALSLEEIFEKFKAGETRELALILKADAQGSLDPIVSSLQDLNVGELKVNMLYAETGNVTENDVMLASASRAIVIGFNVGVDGVAQQVAQREGVSIRQYDVIYRLVEDVEKALKGMLEPQYREARIGLAEVRAIFRISKLGQIAGCYVREGEIRRNAKARVLRGREKIYEGEVASLKHEKDDVREARQGFECGIALKDFEAFERGDLIEAFVMEKVE